MITLLKAFPWTPSSVVDKNDYAVGNDIETVFDIVNKNILNVSSIIQTTGLQYLRFNGGFTRDIPNSQVTLLTPPASGRAVIFPGVTTLTIRAYDQAVVLGNPTPNVKEELFFIGDPTDIGFYKYVPTIGETGIIISITNRDPDTESGIDETNIQLAPMLPDGTAGTYEAPGAPLELGEISAQTLVNADFLALATTFDVDDASEFSPGMYITINAGNPTEDTVRITNIVGNTLTITAVNNNHFTGENVYHSGWGVYQKLTLPTDEAGTHNWFHVSIDFLLDILARS